MSSLGSPNPFFIAGKKAYEIERSLRFNYADSTNLSRTPSSASNRKTWTLSFWLKRGRIANGDDNQEVDLFCSRGNNDATFFDARMRATDKLMIGINTQILIETTQVFRDISAWYHIVVAFDTTQASASNRLKLYVNGSEVTSFDIDVRSSYVTQDGDFGINSTTELVFGMRNNDKYFDGYMAEINLIDGSQLTPASFGATDALTGQWNPKKYGGGYGTNGFYLNFSDNSGTTATTLGKDSSGNSNNFTPNNFSVAAGAGNDSLEDSPTNNFCTLNPLSNGTGANPSNGNLDFATTSSATGTIVSTMPVSSGKWYCEATITFGSNNGAVGIRSVDQSSVTTNTLGNQTLDYAYRGNGQKFNSNSKTSYGSSYTTNDVIGIALDLDGGTIKFFKNNSDQGTAFSSITGTYVFAIGDDNTSSAFNGSFNFGQRAFSYTPPTGFKKLNSANLPDPTIKLPNKHFDTLIWSGNSTNNRAITGLNFQPNFVWIKKRTSSAAQHSLVNSIVGTSDNGTGNGNVGDLDSASTRAEAAQSAGGFESFDANGFTLGKGNNDANADSAYQLNNASSMTYVGWSWNAGDTDGKTYTVTVVDDSGNKYRFDGFGTSAVTLDLAEGGTYIFNYPSAHPLKFSTTADGTHGGGSEYTTGVTHNSSTQVTIVVAASAPTLYYYCGSHSGMGGAVNTNSTLGSSNFDGSKQTVVKANASAGFSIISYTGDGSSGATTGHGLGVAPKIMFHKDRDSSNNWYTITTAVDGSADYLYLNLTNAKGDSGVTAPTSSLVYFTSSSESNHNGRDYIMYAFSEVAGYSKFGSYTGNGNADGTFIYTGFRPAWTMIKSSSATWNWIIQDTERFGGINSDANDKNLAANSNSAEPSSASFSGNQIDYLSNGFKLRSTAANTNASGGTYIFMAFAESPFKNARAR